MKDSIVLGLIQNIAILIIFTMLYDYFWTKTDQLKRWYFKVLSGFVIGVIGIVLMLTPWTLYPGLVFDTRSILLAISGLFFGAIPTLIAIIITSMYRVSMGGDGMWMGIAVIISSGTIGLIWRQIRLKVEKKNNVLELFLLGFLVHLVMLGCTVFLPEKSAILSFKKIFWPVILIYPIGTLLLGALMHRHAKNALLQKTLDESEERWKFALEGSGDGVWDWNAITNEVFFSHQWKALLGFKDHEIGNNFNEWDSRLHPDDKERVNKDLNNFLNGKTNFYSVEHRLKCKDGTYKWIQARGKIITWTDDKKPKRIIGTHTDITERKKIEQDLKRSQQNFIDIAENLPDGVFIANKEGKIVYTNKQMQKIVGYTANELLTMTGWDMTRPKDIPMLKERMKKRMAGQKHQKNYERALIRKDGTEVWTDFSTTTTIWLSEKLPMAIIRDITEKKENEEELIKYRENLEGTVKERTKEVEDQASKLKESQTALLYLLEDVNEAGERLKESNKQLETVNKEIEAFSYSVSHDLRAPLTRLSGFSSALEQLYANKLDEKGIHYLNRIKASSHRMENLIDDMLMLSRISRHKMKIDKVDISVVAQKICRILKKTEPDREVQLKIEKSIILKGDAKLIHIMLENLLSNAWKFTRKSESAIIEVGITNSDQQKVIFIRDNGAGFDMRYVEKVFLPFQRLHAEPDFEGTGVGMATVQRIVNQHEGKIWVESEVDKGTTFYFQFPE